MSQAKAEGLTLQPSDNSVGYRGVYLHSSNKANPFQAKLWRVGKCVYLGAFATAEEAALAYARTPEAQAEVANPKPAPLRPKRRWRRRPQKGSRWSQAEATVRPATWESLGSAPATMRG